MHDSKKKLIYGIYLVLELIIYIAFVSMDLFNGGGTDYIKYSGIVLNLIFSLFTLNTPAQKLNIFILFFTAVADFFLVIKHFLEIGVIVFIIVQVSHFIRIHFNDKKFYISLIIRAVITALCIAFLYLNDYIPSSFLNILVAIYFPQLVLNMIDNIILDHKTIGGNLYSLGLLLFIGCDICVGISNLMYSLTASILIWVFYLPSQVLILISALLTKEKSDEKIE